MQRYVLTVTLALTAFAASGCGDAEARDDARRDAERQLLLATPGYIVDTVHAMDELLRRFREPLSPPAEMRLAPVASSRDALVRNYMNAMRQADTAALEALLIDRAEFAWIYFPGSPYAAEPYELPPEHVWFHTEAETGKGLARAMRAMAGRSVTFHGYTCDDEPERYGDASVWTGCRLQWRDEDAQREWDFRMFGSIIEHHGRFKFVSYANKL